MPSCKKPTLRVPVYSLIVLRNKHDDKRKCAQNNNKKLQAKKSMKKTNKIQRLNMIKYLLKNYSINYYDKHFVS